jgi:hypothetical protein
MNNKIIISSCKGGCSDTNLTEWVTDYPSLVKVLKSPKIGNKDGTYFVRATGAHRSTDTLSKTASVLILDGDSRIDENGEIKSGAPDPAEITRVLTKLGVPHILYSSHSNGAIEAERTADPLKLIDSGGLSGKDYHKYRVIIPCSYSHQQFSL